MDETDEQKDNLQETPGLPSSDESQGTSKVKARTYTEEEKQQAVSDALSAAGREHKTLSERETAVAAREEAVKKGEAKISEFEAAQDAAKLAEAQRDPAKMRVYQAEKAEKERAKNLDEREADIRKEREALDRDKAEQAETVRAAQEVTLGMKLYEIAAKHGLNPEELKKDVKELNLTTEAQVEAYAQRIKPTGERLPGEEGEGGTKPITPVTVPTTGGAPGKLSPEQFEKLSPAEKKKYLDKQ